MYDRLFQSCEQRVGADNRQLAFPFRTCTRTTVALDLRAGAAVLEAMVVL
jgi:hypothetical protein